jgi:hypothetical protein
VPSTLGRRRDIRNHDARGHRQLHVDDHALDGDGLVRDVDDLATGEIVLVVAALGVEPEDVLGRVTVGAVVLQHFAGVVRLVAEQHVEAPGGVVDGLRAEALTGAGDLALHRRVDDHLAGVGGDDVEVLDRARRVVHLQAAGDVVLLDGAAGLRVDSDLDGGLLHAGGRLRRVFLAAGEGDCEDGDGDEREGRVRALHDLILCRSGRVGSEGRVDGDGMGVEGRKVKLLASCERKRCRR